MSQKLKSEDPGRWKRFLGKAALAGLLVIVALGAAVGGAGYLYWKSVTRSPQYSLALMIDAARDGDDRRVNEFIDFDAVVEDFVPQVTAEAVEMYGRGLPPEVIKRATLVAQPLLPVVKSRARAEIPGLLRERTESYRHIPFWALAIGAGRYLDISVDGDKAEVAGRGDGAPLNLKMERRDGKWLVVAVSDQALANQIARKIGQEIIFLARQAGESKLDEAGRAIGLDGIGDLLKQAEEIFK